MPVPLGEVPAGLADYLQSLEDRVLSLEQAGDPALIFSCLKADLPAAASYLNRLAYVTDTKITVVSDGTVWRRQDTGAAI